MKKTALAVLMLLGMVLVTEALAATWYEIRGVTKEDALAKAKAEWGDKLVGEGKCRWDKEDGWVYCKVLINDN